MDGRIDGSIEQTYAQKDVHILDMENNDVIVEEAHEIIVFNSITQDWIYSTL